MSLRSAGRLEAQQPQDNVVATTLFETAFDAPPPGPATVSAATIALAPGQASLTLEGPGTLLILVQSGTVTLLSDQAIAGLASVDDGDEDGGLGNTYHLRTGQRVTLPSIGTIRFRNEGDENASLLLLTLVSEGGPS